MASAALAGKARCLDDDLGLYIARIGLGGNRPPKRRNVVAADGAVAASTSQSRLCPGQHVSGDLPGGERLPAGRHELEIGDLDMGVAAVGQADLELSLRWCG